MGSLRVRRTIKTDGEISVTGLPFKKGQMVEITLRPIVLRRTTKRPLTARALLDSGLPGLWADRDDIPDSPIYARHLRKEAEERGRP